MPSGIRGGTVCSSAVYPSLSAHPNLVAGHGSGLPFGIIICHCLPDLLFYADFVKGYGGVQQGAFLVFSFIHLDLQHSLSSRGRRYRLTRHLPLAISFQLS